MTLYFFDDLAAKLIAFDTDTKAVRELRNVSVGSTVPQFTDEQLFPTRKRVTKEPGKLSPAKGRGRGCPECGSPSRHKKDCSRAGGATSKMDGNDEWKALGEVSAPRAGVMSRMIFGRVKMAHSHDIPPDTIANNLDLAEMEVSKAIEADTYEQYLKS